MTNGELTELLEIAKHAASLAKAIHRRALDRHDIKADIKAPVLIELLAEAGVFEYQS